LLRHRREAEAGDEEIAELAALADGSLPADRRARLEARVASSPELADRLAEQQRAVALARSAAAEVVAPASLRARTQSPRRARGARPQRRRILIGATAIATGVLAIAVGLGAFGSRTLDQHFRAALAATELAPGANGEATLAKTPSGWRIELDATGLPRLANGRFYEAWLSNSRGRLVPVGTFNEGRNVTLWAGVSPEDYPILTVTREPADGHGDQASTGEKVLSGRVHSGG
jgi:anti-sigma-K factor RskA